MSETFTIGFLIYPGVTALDFVGPSQILSQAPGMSVEIIAKTSDPVLTDSGYSILPTKTCAEVDALDMICIPGGTGQQIVMDDEEVVDFVRQIGSKAQFVSSVCSGSLLLGKAGLLAGYKATSHWAFVDDLARYGAIPTHERVVIDRNRITGAGVSAGIDFAFTFIAKQLGEDIARVLQLGIEYDPAPPFDSGSPEKAGPEITAPVRDLFKTMIQF